MSTVSRSIDDARAKHALMGQYIAECDRIESFHKAIVNGDRLDGGEFMVDREEMLEVFERRRDRLFNELKNKGISIIAEASETLPSIAREQAKQNDKEAV